MTTNVTIPDFWWVGIEHHDGRVLVDIDDVALYLARVATVFDEAGADEMIGRAFRAVGGMLADPKVELA